MLITSREADCFELEQERLLLWESEQKKRIRMCSWEIERILLFEILI